MSSKKHKAKIGAAYIADLRRLSALRLSGRWWAIHITKPAFLKPKDLETKTIIEKILKSRGFKIPKNQDYWNYIKA